MLMGVWNKLIPALMGDLEGFTTTMEKVTVDVVETARELLGLKVWLNCCNLVIKLEWMRSYLLWVNKESGFSRWNEYAGEYAMNTVEMAAMDLEYYIKLVDKAVSVFERDWFQLWKKL